MVEHYTDFLSRVFVLTSQSKITSNLFKQKMKFQVPSLNLFFHLLILNAFNYFYPTA